MKFSFDINGIGKEVSYIKEEASAITGVESFIDSNIYGAEMMDAEGEFKAIDVDMTIAINGFEASGNKDNAAAKPGFVKRTWEAIKALFRALGKYIMAAVNWIKKKFKKDKVEKQVQEASTIYSDVSKICDELRKENPNASEEEFAKAAKAKIDEKYGFGYGPEAITPKFGHSYYALSIANIIKEKARLANAHDSSENKIEIEVVLPIEDERIAGPLIDEAYKVAKVGEEVATKIDKEGVTLEGLEKVITTGLTTLINALSLVKMTQRDTNVKIVSDIKSGASEFKDLVAKFENINPINLYRVKLALVPKDLNDKSAILKEIQKMPQYELSRKFYMFIYEAILVAEAMGKNIEGKEKELMNEGFEKLINEGKATEADLNEFRQVISYTQKAAKSFIKAVSMEKLNEATALSTPRPTA